MIVLYILHHTTNSQQFVARQRCNTDLGHHSWPTIPQHCFSGNPSPEPEVALQVSDGSVQWAGSHLCAGELITGQQLLHVRGGQQHQLVRVNTVEIGRCQGYCCLPEDLAAMLCSPGQESILRLDQYTHIQEAWPDERYMGLKVPWDKTSLRCTCRPEDCNCE